MNPVYETGPRSVHTAVEDAAAIRSEHLFVYIRHWFEEEMPTLCLPRLPAPPLPFPAPISSVSCSL